MGEDQCNQIMYKCIDIQQKTIVQKDKMVRLTTETAG